MKHEQSRFKNTRFYKSFQLDSGFLYIILIDLVYYAILFASILIFLRNAIPELVDMKRAKDVIGYISSAAETLYQNDLAVVRGARANLTLYIIILIFVLILNFSCFKLWIWHRIVKRKYKIFPLIRGIVVNFIFFIVIFLSGLAGYYIFKGAVFFIYLLLLILISIYFFNWIHLLFAQTGSISAVYRGIHLGLKRFSHLLLPNLIILILLSLLILIISMFATLNPKIFWPLFFLCIAIFFNWTKYLFYQYKKAFSRK